MCSREFCIRRRERVRIKIHRTTVVSGKRSRTVEALRREGERERERVRERETERERWRQRERERERKRDR